MNHQKEKKLLYTSSTKPYTPKGIMNNKQPEFFSYFLNIFMKIYNFIIFIYIIMNLVLFFMSKIYVKNAINKENLNEKLVMDSNTTRITNFFPTDSNKVKENIGTNTNMILFENEAFTSITFISIYLSTLIVINNLSTSKKSPLFFTIFYLMSIMITINFLTNFLQILPFFKNLTNPFKITNDIISKSFLIFQYIFSGMNFILMVYLVYIYFAQIGYFKYNLENLSFEQFYEEICLRIDMMKISFNFWIISMKLNKVFPGLMYRKKDYYFNKNNLPDDIEEFGDELNDKVNSLGLKSKDKNTNSNMYYSNTKRACASYSSEAIHSKSTIDCEYESFK
jgi:hypothetical protein